MNLNFVTYKSYWNTFSHIIVICIFLNLQNNEKQNITKVCSVLSRFHNFYYFFNQVLLLYAVFFLVLHTSFLFCVFFTNNKIVSLVCTGCLNYYLISFFTLSSNSSYWSCSNWTSFLTGSSGVTWYSVTSHINNSKNLF